MNKNLNKLVTVLEDLGIDAYDLAEELGIVADHVVAPRNDHQVGDITTPALDTLRAALSALTNETDDFDSEED